MATEFGGRIRLNGESEYRSALRNINSELNLLTKAMGDNASSAETMAKKQELVGKKIDEQKKYIDELEQALELAKAKYGENSIEVEKWQTKINNAKVVLIDMEKELKTTEKTLEEVAGLRVV